MPKALEAEIQAVMAEQERDVFRARLIVALRHGLTTGDVVERKALGGGLASGSDWLVASARKDTQCFGLAAREPPYLDLYSCHASRMSFPLNRTVRSSSTSAPVRDSASTGSELRVVYSTCSVTGPFTV